MISRPCAVHINFWTPELKSARNFLNNISIFTEKIRKIVSIFLKIAKKKKEIDAKNSKP